MLIDKAVITVRGGHGGAKLPKKINGPDGGNGGRGGNIYVLGSSNLTLLNQFSQQDFFTAGNGNMGKRNNKTGKDGEDLEILLPIGTSIYDKKTGELILEINKVSERFLICHGGREDERGEEKEIILSLRLIADFGLIGLPNAGKSSLLNELTNAKAKIANYPFTTLEPNLGVFKDTCLADIPGLIEGASRGKGLGITFLKHIEKVEVLLHCISCETANIINDYKTVRSELSKFNLKLTKKPEIIILTKTDLVNEKYVTKLVKMISLENKKIIPVSINNSKSLDSLKSVLH